MTIVLSTLHRYYIESEIMANRKPVESNASPTLFLLERFVGLARHVLPPDASHLFAEPPIPQMACARTLPISGRRMGAFPKTKAASGAAIGRCKAISSCPLSLWERAGVRG